MMRTMFRSMIAAVLVAASAACTTTPPESVPVAVDNGIHALPRLTPARLAAAMAREPVVLSGEVHDNAAQHAMRAQALRLLLQGGARPAIAFEQFDADRQAALNAARKAARGSVAARAQRIIRAAGAKGWNWNFYRPYVELALEYHLPIVAADLSGAQAMKVAMHGVSAAFAPGRAAALGLRDIPPRLLRAQEHEIAIGHCGLAPKDMLAAIATAQIARDAVLAESIRPYVSRGVVLLTGNGHARRDIGVMVHLSDAERARAISIGLLEDDPQSPETASAYDLAFRMPAQARPDPCARLRAHQHGLPLFQRH